MPPVTLPVVSAIGCPKMRLWFFGSGAFGLPTLERLAQAHHVLGVVTQPDRPAGRGRKLTPNPIAAWAMQNLPDRPLVQVERITAQAPPELLSDPGDAWVVIAFGQKLGKSLLADRFAINLHASLLPRWRGAAPINAAMVAGDQITGNSVIGLADRMDAGLVYAQSRRNIVPTQTCGELHDLLAADGPALVMEVLEQHRTGTLKPFEQDESLVTLAPKLSREDARIDLSGSAEVCRRTINGLSPWPGVSVQLEGQGVKLIRAGIVEIPGGEPGTLVHADQGVFACGDGHGLQLLELTPAGKNPMRWADYQRGRSLKVGARISPVPQVSAQESM